jgi:hypothetical protein
LAPTKDQKALNELFGRWTAEQSEVSFPQFAYNCRNEKAALSNELNTLFTNMDIHSEHDSEKTESDDDSIPPYSSANFEDVLHKTEDDWHGYLARISIRLPQGENIISNQTLMATANYISPIRDGLLASIILEDFLPKGRFVEFHIPRYVHIPIEIQDKLEFHGDKGHCAFYCVWRRLYQARMETQEILSHNSDQFYSPDEMAKVSPWIKFLLDSDRVKSFSFDDLDIIQMYEAIMNSRGRRLHNLDNRQLFDRSF